MSAKKAPSGENVIEIQAPQYSQIDAFVLGTTPFICNRQSEKVKHELLSPAVKSRAARAQRLKHDPLLEFRSSPYTLTDPGAPTLLAFLSVAFKKAMMTAALDTPGANKTQIGRLVRVEGERIPLWGVPRLHMSITREASIKRTPDVRTRAILPRWACRLQITFPSSIIKPPSIMNLLSAAGQFAGIGDWRTEKGSGNYGSFKVVNEGDKEFDEVVAAGGRDAQEEAMGSPTPYDEEAAALLEWWLEDATQRGFIK